MFTRVFHMSGKLRLVAVGLTAVIVVLTAGLVFLNARTVHGSGTGGGGGCFPTNGHACHFSSNNAFVDFSSVSKDGCIFTDATLEPFANLTRPGGTPTQTVVIFISKWDNCQNSGGCGSADSGSGGGGGGCGVPLEEASNFDPITGMPIFNGTIQFGPKLDTVVVNGSAPMVDFITGVNFTSTINVSWKGYGPTSTFMDIFSDRQPGFMMKSHTSGSSRSAEASGVITDETGVNLATSPVAYANISDSKGGTVEFSRF
jgi:hypothetical protein